MRQLGTIASAAVLQVNTPAHQIRREIWPTNDDFQSVLDKIPIEIEDIKGEADSIPIGPETRIKQKKESSAGANDFEFRPLTEEEKQEFMDSLDAKGRQILAELAGEAKSSGDPAENAVPLCCL
jgi:hypothetical protein